MVSVYFGFIKWQNQNETFKEKYACMEKSTEMKNQTFMCLYKRKYSIWLS